MTLSKDLIHELTQPLTAISMYTEGCIKRLESNNYQKEELLNVLKQISAQSSKAMAILEQKNTL